MDKYEPIRQVLTLGRIPVELVAGPHKAAELARLPNDDMAELVHKYPDRFVADRKKIYEDNARGLMRLPI